MRSILRIDMGAAGGPSASLAVVGGYAGLSGRAIVARILADEVEPACPPLGASNRLVVAPGPRGAPGRSARVVAIGCASPLSGALLVSDAPAPAGNALRRLGYAAVIVEGRAERPGLWTLVIDANGVSFASAAPLHGLGNLEVAARLRRAHGPGAALLSVGAAGEARLAAASVTAPVDAAGAVRHCGRGGAGAVMGAKRLKAIVVVGGAPADEGSPAAPLDDPDPYREACGIDDPVTLAALRRLEDDLGVEGAEIARAVGAAMQAGLARAGDGGAALRLVAEIGGRTPLGRILGSGARAARNALGLAADPVATRVFGPSEDEVVRLVDALEPGRPALEADAPPGTRLHAGSPSQSGSRHGGGPSRKN